MSESSSSASAYNVSLSSNIVFIGFDESSSFESSRSSSSAFGDVPLPSYKDEGHRRSYSHLDELPYPSLMEEYDHIKRFFDIWNLLFQASPPLSQITVHVSILAALSWRNI